MTDTSYNKLVSFIWSIVDYCLCDVYVRGKYRYVILPMIVLRRLDALLEPSKEAVLVIHNEMGLLEIMSQLMLSDKKNFRKEHLLPSIEGGYIEMTISIKPTSPNQKYRLTQKGALLKNW